MGVFSSFWILVGDCFPFFATHQVYVVAAFCGIAGTCLQISSLGLNSDLVGINNSATNAFVFAAMVCDCALLGPSQCNLVL